LALLYTSYRQKQLLNRKNLEATRLKALLEGQTLERQRISQELHDDMGSGLTTILFVSRALSNPATQHPETYTRLTNLASDLIDKMNEIVWAMSNDHDSLPGLVTYIRANTAETLRNAGIAVIFSLPPEVPDITLTQHMRHHVYLIVKEAVHNIITHAEAGAVTISMAFGTDLAIRIHDNGKGINNTVSASGNGLRNMQRRAGAIGGTLNIARNNGTVVELRLPLDV
jgi:signal transduction histidine kinase